MYSTAAISVIDPQAYWSLGSNVEQISQNSSYNASFTNVVYTSTPIINNDQAASKSLIINSNSSVDILIPAGNTRDLFKYKDRGWCISFWFNFNNQLKGSGYGTTPYKDNKLEILQIIDGSGNDLGLIYYDYLTNTFRFNLTDVYPANTNTEAYSVLPEFDRNYLIVAEYVPPQGSTTTEGKLNIYINGKTQNYGSGKINCDTARLFLNSGTVKFKIDGSSLFNTAEKPKNFIFTSLAISAAGTFYNQSNTRTTDGSNQKFNYMYKSAFINNDPKNQARMNASTSYFDFNSYSVLNKTISRANLFGEDFKNEADKIILMDSDPNNGLSVTHIDSENFATIKSYSADSSQKLSDLSDYQITSNGIKLSTSSTQRLWWSIDKNIISNISSPNQPLLKSGDVSGTTISMQITKGSASSENLITLYSLNTILESDMNNRLYLKYYLDSITSSWHYTLFVDDDSREYNNTTTLLDQVFSASTASANIALSLSENNITLYTSEGGTSSIGIENSFVPITSYSLDILIGNKTTRANENNFTGFIKNLGICPQYYSDFSSYDFTELKFLMTRFTSYSLDPTSGNKLFPPSVKSTYIKTINDHLSTLNCYLIGSQISWNTMDNAIVSISTDGGKSYNTINKYQPITMYDLFEMTKVFMLRIDIIDDPISLDSKQKYFNNLSYYMFTDLGLFSDVAQFTIQPTSSKFLSNYTLMDYDEIGSVYSRPANFGIKFTGDSFKSPSSALISNPNGSAYNVIEMWYRPDYLPEKNLSRTNMLFNPSGENTNPNLFYINYNTANTLYTSTASPLFGSRHWVFDSRLNNYQIRLGFNRTGAATSPLRYLDCVPGETYTFSFYLKDAAIPSGSVLARLRFFNSSASTIALSTTTTTSAVYTSSWTRIYVTASAPSNSTASLNGDLVYPEILSASLTTNAASTTRCYIDGVMLEKASNLDYYFDGNSPGASWTGTSNGSPSQIFYASTSTYILNNVSGSLSSPAIFLNTRNIFQDFGGTLYINGASYTDGTFAASTSELYHLALVLDSPTSDNLYLNGEGLGASASRGVATYGHLQFWHYQPTETEILSRFDSFFYVSSASVFDPALSPKPYNTSLKDRFVAQKIT